MFRTDCKTTEKQSTTIQVEDDGFSDQDDRSGNDEKWLDSGESSNLMAL